MRRLNHLFTNTLSQLRKEYDGIENRISKLADDKYDGCITEEFYNKKFKEYTEKQVNIAEQISKHDKADKEHCITANTILNLAKRAREIFESFKPEEKRYFLNFILQNCELKGRNLLFKLKTSFETMSLANKNFSWLPVSAWNL